MCRHTAPSHTDVGPALSAAGAARAFVRRHACRRHGADLVPATELVVSELVTNAVRHGAPPVVVDLDCVYGVGVVVRVSDSGDQEVHRQTAEAGGRGHGLVVVAALASDWGVDAAGDGGKTVWASLDPEAAVTARSLARAGV